PIAMRPTLLRCTTALMGVAARSSARTAARAPPCFPTGVRSAAQMYASVISRIPHHASRFPSQSDPDGLRLGVVLQRLFPEISSEPGELVAAERRCGIVEVVRVDPDSAGLDGAGHAVRLLDVLGPDAGGEAVHRAVGELDAFGLVREREHREYRPEDLLVHDLHAGLGAVKYGRLDVVALAVHLRRLAPRYQAGAL